MPVFRPLPWLSVFSVLSLILLIWLGSWQMQRMAWKADLQARFEDRIEVSGFDTAMCGTAEQRNGRIRAPQPLLGEQLRYYSLREIAGWVRVGLVPVRQCDGEGGAGYLLVEGGFEGLNGEIATRPERWRLETLPSAGFFTPDNDPDTNQWYSFDRAAMAAALGVREDEIRDVWARTDDGLPASLSQTPPAKHLGYAVTWFGLAASLLLVYLALHVQRGRLAWRTRMVEKQDKSGQEGRRKGE